MASSLCVCLVSQSVQSAAAADDDDDDDDDKVPNEAITVWLILEISRMLFLAQVCCPFFMAYCVSPCNLLFS